MSSGDSAPTPGADPIPEPARPIVDRLVEVAGEHIRSVLLYGSQLVRASPSPHSAWDLVVIVDDYGPFHRALVKSGHHRRPAWLLSALGHVLAPNVTAFDPGGGAPLAKCQIVRADQFERAVGRGSPDHFLKGRMVQKVALLWARHAGAAQWTRERLARARDDVLNWAGPYMIGGFTPAELAHGMLRVSYGGELRPESANRVDGVFEAQRDYLTEAYTDVLERAVKAGRARRIGGGRYALNPRPGAGARVGLSIYFTWSKVRATARWAKHVLTFNDWLTYIQRKVERRTGMTIHLTTWERRLPLLLLWPKVFRVLTAGRQSTPIEDGSALEDGGS